MPVAFQFAVSISGWMNAFQEVSGMDKKIDIQTVQEGGENRFSLQLPRGTRQQALCLKRGIAESGSPLVAWCKDVIEGGLSSGIVLHDVQVCLCDENLDFVRIWWFYNAFPVRWSVDTFNSTKNEVAIETIELAYQHSCRTK